MHGPVLALGVTSAAGAAPGSGGRRLGERAELGFELRGVEARAWQQSSAWPARGTCRWTCARGPTPRHFRRRARPCGPSRWCAARAQTSRCPARGARRRASACARRARASWSSHQPAHSRCTRLRCELELLDGYALGLRDDEALLQQHRLPNDLRRLHTRSGALQTCRPQRTHRTWNDPPTLSAVLPSSKSTSHAATGLVITMDEEVQKPAVGVLGK